ncbi:MAG: acetylxylan esterase [Phycisphaerae bacterium]|nr:acetylxylan esterase [Phycisphaerae bacterium]
MTIRPFLLAFPMVLLVINPLSAREPKEADKDVIYDESKVPPYDLPPLLVSSEGKAIATPEEWLGTRRPQIISMFASLVYGAVPTPQSPLKITSEVVKTDRQFLGGTATRKDVRIAFENTKGRAQLLILVFTPNEPAKPAPVFLILSFDNTRSNGFTAHPTEQGILRNGWPIGEFVKRGFGFVVVYQADLVGHNEVDFLNSVQRLFYSQGQSFPKAHEWGGIATVAWSASRVLDYLASDHDVDASRVAIMGHSKCGKAALWAAARDPRFAMVVAAESGHGGAALWRRKCGETLEKMVTRFPYWLCRNALKFANHEDDLPVDQHMLLACIAPRPLYVMSGVEDTWADPRGEYLSAYHASAVYRLLGKKGLESDTPPPVGQAIIKSDVGYHIRAGGHSLETFDCERVLDFADYHLTKR